jgi:hypothetical protein
MLLQPGWPTDWDEISNFIPYDEDMNNMCLDCSRSNLGVCANHVQSPINLARAVTSDRECIGTNAHVGHVINTYGMMDRCAHQSISFFF